MVHRKSSGDSAVELVAGIIVLIPVLLFLLDLGVCVLGLLTNDNICRQACRAAAAGRPTSYTPVTALGAGSVAAPADSFTRAQSVLATTKTGGYVGQPTFIGDGSASSTGTGPTPDVAPPPVSGGGAWQGSYLVTTQVVVTLPATISGVLPVNYTFKSQHLFPLTRIESPQAF